MLITKEVEVRVNPANIKHFNDLGYKNIKSGNRINIPVEHLSKGSHTKIKVKCDICGNKRELEYILYFKNTKNNTRKYTCSSKCAHLAGKNKKTNLELYGNENYNNRKQAKETCLEKYNVEHPMMLDKTKEKSKQTCLLNNGVEWSLQSPEIREKGKITRKEKYNDENYRNIEQMKQTKLENHGDENYVNPEKAKETNLKKHGVENVFQLEEIKNKAKQTKKELYNDENYNNREKMFETRYKFSYDEYLEQLPDFLLYKNIVWKFTRKQPLNELENIEKRKKRDYWLDHKFSVSEGFKQNIPPYIIGNIINLEMIPFKENIFKYNKCSISKEELFEKFDVKETI